MNAREDSVYLYRFGLLVLGEELVCEGALPIVRICSYTAYTSHIPPHTYLESSSHAEDAVVGLLLGETFERKLDGLIFLGDQVVGSAELTVSIFTHPAR